MKLLKLLLPMLIALAGLNAHAIAEFRLTYGLLGSTPDLAALYSGGGSVPSVAPTYGIGGDFIFVIPIVGLGAGIRYENLTLNVTSNGVGAEATNNRTALIVNYRLIDTLLLLGPIFTYGITHSGNLKTSLSGVTVNNWNPGSMSSYSLGLEVGAKLVGFTVGAEAGYQSLQWSGFTDSAGAVAGAKDINMSGTYAKVFLGFAI